jgi:hypothetical protein
MIGNRDSGAKRQAQSRAMSGAHEHLHYALSFLMRDLDRRGHPAGTNATGGANDSV